MPRGKKQVEEVVEQVELAQVEEVVAPQAPKAKEVLYSISASFKTRNLEGERVTHKYNGTGKSVAEALEAVVGNDEDVVDEYNKPFPKGINMLVNCVVRTSEGYEFARALAPHVAKDIFENKNVLLAIKLLGL